MKTLTAAIYDLFCQSKNHLPSIKMQIKNLSKGKHFFVKEIYFCSSLNENQTLYMLWLEMFRDVHFLGEPEKISRRPEPITSTSIPKNSQIYRRPTKGTKYHDSSASGIIDRYNNKVVSVSYLII